jgi:hypothetical protein
MATEDRELGPFKPAPDMLILAAIERAIRHGASDAWIVVVGEHLGFERTAHNTRRLRRQLEHLRAKYKWVASRERYGREYWSLTLTGQRYLAAARKARQVGELPESPQHREWRHAQAEAGRRMEGFRALLGDALEDADPVATAFTPSNSAAWFALGQRLSAAFWLLGSAIYCLEEWPEPDDACLDSDENPGPAPGRRVISAWDEKEAMAKEATK